MLPYFVTILLVAILSSTAQKYKLAFCSLEHYDRKLEKSYRFFVFLTAAVLIFVAGVRYRVGTDYMSYTIGYETRAEHLWQDIIEFSEPGLGFIAYISHYIYDDYATMIFIASIITVGAHVVTINKYSEDFFFSMMLYIFIGAWHGSFNGIRQYLAAAVLFLGHRYLLQRSFWKYLLVVLAAACFHLTAFVMLPVYFLVREKIDIKTISLVLLTGDVLFEIMGFIKGRDQSEYEYMTTDVNIFRILVAFAPLLLMVFARKRFLTDTENAFYVIMLVINAVFLFATSGSAYLARIGIYTDVYATLAFPKLLKVFQKRDRNVLKFIILALYGLYWFYEVWSRDSLNHFRWIFSR